MRTRIAFPKAFLAGAMLLSVLTGVLASQTRAAPPPPVDAISLARFHDEDTYLYEQDIQALLDVHGSLLAHYHVYFPISDGEASAANIIAGAALRNNLNPKVLLTLIELQTGLITTHPAEMNDLKFPFGRDESLPEGFAAQLWQVAETLNRDFVRYAVERDTIQAAMADPEPMNGATWAIARQLDGDTSAFAVAYADLFGDVPTSEPDLSAQAITAVNLTSPYEGEFDDPDEITALFDHEYPTYENGYYLTHWSGDNRPGATFDECTLGWNCYTGHDSYDYGIPAFSPILAAADGTVVFIGPDCAGTTVTLLHEGGYRTAYWHLRQPLVALNQLVSRGDVVGLSGGDQGGCSTGAHLHFNVTLNNKDTDPFGWEGDYPEPCVENDTCAPGQFLWNTGTLPPTATPTATGSPIPTSTTPTATPTPHPDGDSYEPDDDDSLANPIVPFAAQIHSIKPVGDRDWVTFSLDTVSAVAVWTNGLTSDDTGLKLYDANLLLMESDDDSGFGLYSRIDRTCSLDPLFPGTYYVEAEEFGDYQTIESYTLEFTKSPCSSYPTITPTPTQSPSGYTPRIYVPFILTDSGESIAP